MHIKPGMNKVKASDALTHIFFVRQSIAKGEAECKRENNEVNSKPRRRREKEHMHTHDGFKKFSNNKKKNAVDIEQRFFFSASIDFSTAFLTLPQHRTK